MKQLSRVVWSEGMYLAPHHFQAQSRYFENAVHFATANLWYEPYGFLSCRLDEHTLRNGIVSLLYARGLFPDGLPFDIPESDSAPSPLTIVESVAASADSLTIYLSVPRFTPNGHNCASNGEGQQHTRYLTAVELLRDENTGSDDKPVQLARKNLKLVLEDQLSENELALPLVRVVRDASGLFAFDPAFVPPCLHIKASERLLSIVSRLVEVLGEKSAIMAAARQGEGKFQSAMSSHQVTRFWFLHTVNSSLVALQHLLSTKDSHPEELFREMSRLAGALCTFAFDSHPRSLPSYDHQHLDRCFDALDGHIRRHLDIVLPSNTISIALKPAARYFYEGDISDERCFARSRWVFGIHSPIGEAGVIMKTPELVKICSSKFVPELVKRALPGLGLSHLPVPPSAIPAKVENQYFVINKTGPCWEHMMQTRRVGVYVPGDLPSPELELIVILEN